MSLIPTLADELSLEIIRLAATPVYEVCDEDPNPHYCYSTALSLARVSSNFYVEVMPILLDTVSLRTRQSLLAFQRLIHKINSRQSPLAHRGVDFPRLIQKSRIYSKEIYGNTADTPSGDYLDYKPVYDVLKNARAMGIHVDSTYHLLYNALDERGVPADDWTCRDALFWGGWTKWKELTCSIGGLAFLRQLKRLTIWIDDKSHKPSDDPRGLPAWTRTIPFHHMPNLTHFACTLTGSSEAHTPPTRMMVYIAPPSALGQDRHVIEQWILNPLDRHGVVVEFSPRQYSTSTSLEEAYFCGDGDRAWEEASRRLALLGDYQGP
ncbi:hypothetical protein DXG03_003587 [Asterophora parasitica]|uniref:Uncharacterized protein n=1 Tax=Asterophora parasitica TaxID=117018 RepID=A0A9P7K894_9AGAR|nr:hypothetical protein DXG03_003587 [Asterophora parasitica]